MVVVVALLMLIAYHGIFIAIGFALGKRAARKDAERHGGAVAPISTRDMMLREIDSDAFAAIVGEELQERLWRHYRGIAEPSLGAPPTAPSRPQPAIVPRRPVGTTEPAVVSPGPVLGPPIPATPPEPIYGPPIPAPRPKRRDRLSQPLLPSHVSRPRPHAPREPIRLDPALVLLYLGAFLIVAAGLIYASFNWEQLEGGQKLALLAAATAGFIAAGLALLGNARVRPAAETFVGVGALLIPSNIIAAVTILSGTPLRATLALQLGAALATLLYTVFSYRPGATIYRYAAVISASIAIGVLPASLGAHRGWALPMLALAPVLVIGAIDRAGDRAGRFRIPALRTAMGIPAVALAATPVVGLPAAHDALVAGAILAGMAVTFGAVAAITQQVLLGHGAMIAALGAVASVAIATTEAEPLRLAIPPTAGLLLLLLVKRGPHFFRTTLADPTTFASVFAFGLTAVAPNIDDDRLATWGVSAAPALIAAGWALVAWARRWTALMLPAIVLAYLSHGLALDRLGLLDTETSLLAWLLPGTVVAAAIPTLAARWPWLPDHRSYSFFLWLGFGAIALVMGPVAAEAGYRLGMPIRALAVGYLLLFAVASVVAAQQHRQRPALVIGAGWLVVGVLLALEPVPVAEAYRWPLLAGVFAALTLAAPRLEGTTWWRQPANLGWPLLVLVGAAAATATPMLIYIGEFLIEPMTLAEARWWPVYAATLATAAVVFGLHARYRYPEATTAVAAVSGMLAIALVLRAGAIHVDPDPLVWPAIGIGIGLAVAIAADRLDRMREVLAKLWARWTAGFAAMLLLLSLTWAIAQTAGYINAAWSSASVAHGDDPIWWTPFLAAYVATAVTAHRLARRRAGSLLSVGIGASAASTALAASLVLSAGMEHFDPEPIIWTAIGIVLAALVATVALRIGDIRTEVARQWSASVATMALVLAVPSLLWALPNTLAYIASGWTDDVVRHGDAPAWWLPLLGAYIVLALATNGIAWRYDLRQPTPGTAAAGLIAIALATRMVTTDTFIWTVIGLAIGLAALASWVALQLAGATSGYRAGWIPVAQVVAALAPIALVANVAAGIAGEIDPWRNVTLYAVLVVVVAAASVRLRVPEGIYGSTGALGLTVLFVLLTPQVDALDGLLIPAGIAWVLVLGSLAPRLTRPWARPLEYSGYAFGAVPVIFPFLRTSRAWEIDSGIYARVTLAIVSLGLVVGLAAVVRRSPVRASVAIPLVMAGVARQVATYEPESWRAYAVVLAIALAATGLAWHRTRRVSDPLYGLAGAVLVGVPFVESFTIGGTTDAFIAGGLAVLVVVLGLAVRRQPPVAAGVIGVTLVVLRQLVDTAMAFESWQVLGTAGAILLIGGTIILLVRDALRRWWDSGRRFWATLG